MITYTIQYENTQGYTVTKKVSELELKLISKVINYTIIK